MFQKSFQILKFFPGVFTIYKKNFLGKNYKLFGKEVIFFKNFVKIAEKHGNLYLRKYYELARSRKQAPYLEFRILKSTRFFPYFNSKCFLKNGSNLIHLIII